MSLYVEPEHTLQVDKETLGTLNIRRAGAEDLPIAWNIIDICAKQLADDGLNHWAKYYNEGMMAKMIAKKEVFLGFNNDMVVGTVTVDARAPKYYIEPGYGERFTSTDEKVAYMTALAVLPDQRHHGFAGQMLEFVEDKAIRNGVVWLRLDCRAEVPGLVAFYEKRGFKKLGEEPVDEGEDGTYWLMEKRIGI